MNTPAHLLMGLAACGRPGMKSRNAAAFVGAFLPDATIIAMVLWQGWVVGRTDQQIFGTDYFTDFWQEIFAVSNSIPIFLACAAFGLLTRHRWAAAFAGAAILHVLTDIPLHAGDGHPPFWPFSDWTYMSPFSYWDVRYGAAVLAPAEFLLCAGLLVWLWRTYQSVLARVTIGSCLAIEALFVFAAEAVYGM